ncbi:MAG: VOC family protein [Candidatus Heimdallarchaeota archaeon]
MKPFSSQITFLETDNLEATTKFYTSIMKCKLVVDQGLCRIFAISKSAFIGFCSHEFLDKDKNTVCLTFVCTSKEEVDEWYNHLVANKIETKAPPKENAKFKIYNFFAKDPNGIVIEVQYFLHPFPPE